MAVNGHFASMGANGKVNFEHGIQIVDEDKEFKYVHVLLLSSAAPFEDFRLCASSPQASNVQKVY